MSDDLIRKALEQRLNAQHAALLACIPSAWIDELAAKGFDDKFPIKWPNIAFDPNVITYLQFTFHPTDIRHPELGPNSRAERTGHAMIGIRVPEATGDDIAGKLAKVIDLAYPYAAGLDNGGLTVRIESVDDKGGVPSYGKWYRPLHINWLVTRRPS